MAEAAEQVKEAFERWVQGWGWDNREKFIYPYNEVVFDVEGLGSEWPLTKLLGKLWRCTEVMPDDICERTDFPSGSTYAQAAQKIMSAGRRGKYFLPRTGYRITF